MGRDQHMARPIKAQVTASQQAAPGFAQASFTMMPAVTKVGYSPTKLYTASTDTRGHYEETRTKFPPSMMDIMERVVDHNPGFGSKQDVIRNCVVHWLKEMSNDPNAHIPPDLVQHEIRMAEFDRILRFDKAIDDEVTRARETFESCVANEAWTTLNNAIESIQEQIALSTELEPGQVAKLEAVIEEGWTLVDRAEATARRRQQ